MSRIWTSCGVRGIAFALAALSSLSASEARPRVVFEKESLYHEILVEEEGSVRTLYFRRAGERYPESMVDVAHPLELLMEYSQLMFASFLFVEKPERVLVIGLGGGTIPRVVRAHFPEVEIDCVELDPDVAEAAKKYFLFEESPKLRVHVLDGRRHVRRLAKEGAKYDIVMLDAFRGGYIPFHLTTKEFLELCRSILSEKGVLASNLQPSFRDYDYCRRTLAAVFADQRGFRGSTNTAVVAAPRKLDLDAAALKARAERIAEERKLGFDLVRVAARIEAAPGYRTRGAILTDDYAPVEVLRGRPRE
ncbi:MAG: spermidine synthase [Planctomycetota bacterium]